MDPITAAIVGAVVSGAAGKIADAGLKAAGGAYQRLKAALRDRFGIDSDLAAAMDQLEAKPDSEARRNIIAEEIQSADANSHAEIVAAAQALLDVIKDRPEAAVYVQQVATGTGIGAMAEAG